MEPPAQPLVSLLNSGLSSHYGNGGGAVFVKLSQVDDDSIGSGTEDHLAVVRHHSSWNGELSDGGEGMSPPDTLGMDGIW